MLILCANKKNIYWHSKIMDLTLFELKQMLEASSNNFVVHLVSVCRLAAFTR